MQMLGQHNDGIGLEWLRPEHFAKCPAQEADVVDEHPRLTVVQGDGEEIGTAGDVVPSKSHHYCWGCGLAQDFSPLEPLIIQSLRAATRLVVSENALGKLRFTPSRLRLR